MSTSFDVIKRLHAKGFRVSVIVAREAAAVFRPARVRSAAAAEVLTDMFELPESWDVKHISLAERASLIIVCPATANSIAKVACGICDDLLSCVICASKAPVMFVPALGSAMFANTITLANIRKLESLGYHFVGPHQGQRAGAPGTKRMADAGRIVREAERLARRRIA
jgi:phosphopantothenoylcysteine decarboxylase/phosphopantothenate--cysteine ligase